MLVLSRKITQAVRLPQVDVTVTVTGVSGRTVKLGIDAPAELAVVRAEREAKGEMPVSPAVTALRQAAAAPAGPGPDVLALRESLHRLTLHLALAEHELGGSGERVESMYEQLTAASEALDGLERAAERRREEEDRRPAIDPAGTPSGRVLLVSDDAEERRLLASLMTRWGVAVETASGAAAADRLTDRHGEPFDLVLADLPASDAAAAEALRQLRAAAAAARPVRLMAVGFGDLPCGSHLELADEFLAKPVDPRALAARVRSIALAS